MYDNTIIVYWSDHGVGLPRAKRWLYDSGTRIPLIVRIPPKFRHFQPTAAGETSDELICSVDFAPTMLHLAGIQAPDFMQGLAFLGKDRAPKRQYVYGARDRMDERYDIIRTVRDRRWRYIRNFEPLKPYYQYMNTPEKGATMKEIRRAEVTGSLPANAQPFSRGSKPVEELYDTESDPHEIHNLALDPNYRAQLVLMRRACLAWQSEVRDLGLVPEAEIEVREQAAGSRYEILRWPGGADMIPVLVDVAAKASEGEAALPELLAALKHDEASVRYWGATGLGNVGDKAGRKAAKALRRLLKDSSPSVRIAAARGLCRMGDLQGGLPVLATELASPHQWGRLAAAIALDELDEAARPVLADLQSALVDQPNKYIVRVANKAVNDLLGTQNVVR